jgi:tRNA pseudouridine55 synthase
VVVPRDAWDWSKVPGHLRPTFRVLGEAGAVVAEGKDLEALKAPLRPKFAEAMAEAASDSGLDVTGQTTWTFGTVERTFTQTRAGHEVRGFPALVDEGTLRDASSLGSSGQVTEPGLVVVDKPSGMTSHDVVTRLRRLAGTRKVGHAGTLDPMATGVLLVGVERATRLLGHLTLTEKAYDATIRLGAATTTDDAEGETLSTASVAHLTEDDVRSAAGAFVGVLEQKPSAVSAVKVDGKRAYARVRAGEEVDLPARTVTVHELLVTDVRPGEDAVDVDVSVRCSSGTYIRAIARDLGAALGVGGHLTMLRRTAVGPFTLADAHDLDTLADELRLVGIDDVARRCFATYDLSEEQARDVGYGRKLEAEVGEGTVAVLAPDGRFLALYEQRGPVAAPVAVFA